MFEKKLLTPVEIAIKTLLLLRHAKSDLDEPWTEDHERPLAARGVQAAMAVGTYMREQGLIPEQVLCSTAVRCRNTLALASFEWDAAPKVDYAGSLYLAGPESLLQAIRGVTGLPESLLLVAHNPDLQSLSLHLSADEKPTEARARIKQKMPTAGLVVFRSTCPAWSELSTVNTHLVDFVTPRELMDRSLSAAE